ncbi:hypothetical protein DIS24_g5387 [Lasiodiplodia hormozganensis]|uniref:TauD/TfdA-like domain-containing protein n=1 Tax=Lasiodiplodia hormozganensis TaxID=869390 RepID=A0AA39YKD0_9PEZI|nr:hypothetical protein DIS24_g5387 [Lasiodiplodia hormozganensis]
MIAPLKFHADRNYADIIALFVKSQGAYGGNQYLSSFWTVFNDLRVSNPQALEILAQDFPWPGVKNEQPATTYTPVIFQHAGRVFCQLVYRIFEGTNLLSRAQWNALDALEEAANRHCIELKAQPGDIQLFNNLALLHARRTWIDRPGKERHLFRLGIRDPQNAWERPPKYAWLFDDKFGIPPEAQTVPITDFDPYGLTTLENQGHG